LRIGVAGMKLHRPNVTVVGVEGGSNAGMPEPLLTFVRKLTLSPADMTQADADAVFSAGWDEKALHDAIAITARMAFMQRLVEGYGFVPLSKEVARKHAKKRVKLGYVNLYRAFAKPNSDQR
jgi:hypothetical protein